MADQAIVDAAADLEQTEAGEKEHRRELHLFNQIATITAPTLDLQEIINEVLSTVLEFFQIEAGLLLLWDRVKQRLTYAASRGFPRKYLEQLSGGKLAGIIGPNLADISQPLIISDIHQDPRLFSSTFTEVIRHDKRFRAVASIPLKYREDLTGFLNLASATPKTFLSAKHHRYFLGILGNQIGLAIENARLYHELRRSERRYRRIFEGSKDMIFVSDREGRLLDLNPAGVELLGFAGKSAALGLPHIREIFQDPQDWERFQLKVEVENFVRDLELTLNTQGGRARAWGWGCPSVTASSRNTGDGSMWSRPDLRALPLWWSFPPIKNPKKTSTGEAT